MMIAVKYIPYYPSGDGRCKEVKITPMLIEDIAK